MNYEQARKLLFTERKPDSKKVGHNTYSHRHEDGSIGLTFHNTEIIRWFPNGTRRIRIGGYWTHTTMQRLKEYLWGCSVWSLGWRVGWVLHTRSGSRPLMSDCMFDEDWRRQDLGAANDYDAVDLAAWSHEYAVEYSKRLVGRRLDEDCSECVELTRGSASQYASRVHDAHFIRHMRSDLHPPSLLKAALRLSVNPSRTRKDILENLVEECLAPRKPKKLSEDQILTRAERLILDGHVERVRYPHEHRKDFRQVLERFLLEAVGFEPLG